MARLTVAVPAAGQSARAIAIYCGPQGDLEGAPGEGVACVDDAARAIEVLAAVWQANHSDRVREWATGLLDFVLWMHQGDGLWLNFITDWSGRINSRGITSAAGVNFWQARGLAAMVSAATVFGDARAARVAELAFAAAAASPAPPDVRALHVLALLRWLGAGHGGRAAHACLARWADEIAAVRSGSALLNSSAERGAPHLWGHAQEAALAGVAVQLRRPDLMKVAQASAAAVFERAIRSGFDLPRVQPYDVQVSIQVMDSLATATGRPGYERLALLARAWFDGRNPARRPVYHRESGAVADGIDHGIISNNSGAESNVAGALALPLAALASWDEQGSAGRS